MAIGGGTSAQGSLFDVAGPADETAPNTLSVIRDNAEISRLVSLLRRLRRADTSLDRVRLAAEVRDLADGVVGNSIREAKRAGQTWRQIGTELGVPFQTLYRRYGAIEGYEESVGSRRVANS